ncbi:hypothetical protein MBM_09295 [Drepanopeziza brunnea f. sp. 'multigermtubi' MB_m1]|uniref:Uncharacterized protein n=1 Tax=Marssonina brunnea f. sp. multigermtubi (strain MB_m1) TaxID=1072389 RepID=K1XJC9_MARBU|nr:uncharacterized protein MBM_09295 [Drepanopeziza brunnea f. sp. 'multigermtubi' MB_m1]EKD12539.1 hypothetical protein MBM_09295 [Drepanopeziza brunnea f. sp. 'multigermtubi' MB_m1]
MSSLSSTQDPIITIATATLCRHCQSTAQMLTTQALILDLHDPQRLTTACEVRWVGAKAKSSAAIDFLRTWIIEHEIHSSKDLEAHLEENEDEKRTLARGILSVESLAAFGEVAVRDERTPKKGVAKGQILDLESWVLMKCVARCTKAVLQDVWREHEGHKAEDDGEKMVEDEREEESREEQDPSASADAWMQPPSSSSQRTASPKPTLGSPSDALMELPGQFQESRDDGSGSSSDSGFFASPVAHQRRSSFSAAYRTERGSHLSPDQLAGLAAAIKKKRAEFDSVLTAGERLEKEVRKQEIAVQKQEIEIEKQQEEITKQAKRLSCLKKAVAEEEARLNRISERIPIAQKVITSAEEVVTEWKVQVGDIRKRLWRWWKVLNCAVVKAEMVLKKPSGDSKGGKAEDEDRDEGKDEGTRLGLEGLFEERVRFEEEVELLTTSVKERMKGFARAVRGLNKE